MVAAIPLAFIIPAMCYIRLEEGPFLSKKKSPAVILALFGFIVTIFGTITIILKVTRGNTRIVHLLTDILKRVWKLSVNPSLSKD